MGIIAAGQITVVDLSDAPVLNTFITASRPTTQTYSKDSRTYKPSYASTPQVLTLKVTKGGSTANIIDSISSLHWFVVDGPIKTEITSKDNSANEYISGAHNEILTTKLDIDLNKGSKRYEVMGIWPDPSTGLDVQFGGYIDLLLTQNGATGPQGPQGNTGNGIANTVVTYGLSMSDTTEPATWSSERPALVKGMYLWTRTVIIYTNGSSTTSYQISYIAKDADATAEIDKAKQELLEKLETVRDDSLEAVEEAKQQLVTVRDESLAAAEEAKQGLANVNTKVDNAKAEIDKAKQDLTNVASELNTAKQDLADSVTAVNNKVDNAKEELTQAKQDLANVADDLSTAKQDFQNAVSAVDTKATNLKSDLAQAKQDLASQAQQLQEQAGAQSELTNRVSSVEETANGTKTTVSELSKTVAQNGKDITSVTARTKVVEDDLAGTKTTLSQVQTTANTTSQKTATLETGLNGLSARFDSLKIGSVNLLHNSKGPFQPKNSRIDNYTVYQNTWIDMEQGKEYTLSAKGSAPFTSNHTDKEKNEICLWLVKNNENVNINRIISSSTTGTDGTKFIWNDPTGKYYLRVNTYKIDNSNYVEEVQIEEGNLRSTYSQNEADLEQKVAEYKQNADQNYASLQTTVQNLDGTVQHNKTVADQTAQGFSTRIESLETYKDGESERANAYFESAKTETAKQLTAERTAIAKDYVAKSTYTSDVTGIRNELSATTSTANATKTNLANYQASNDRAVANLQTNLQTANGNISSLKTKVEAVPGQITSAVSAVEGKIPTEIGTVNLVKGTGSAFVMGGGITNTTWNETKKQTILDFSAPGVRRDIGGEILPQGNKFFDFKPIKGTTYTQSIMIDTDATFNPNGQTQCTWFTSNGHNPKKAYIKKVGVQSYQVWSTCTWELEDIALRAFDLWDLHNVLLFRTTGTYLAFYKPKLTSGNLPSDWSPSPQDYDDAITQVKSEIKQTADGMTLLATKTELSTAKNELQSGINTATNKANSNAQTISTHTTQISALNTGLQAKVSQTDFNTLSGRVTTAENNITAKANELSSKITSVEGKIPTSVGGRNYIRDYGLTATGWISHKSGWSFEIIKDSTAKSGQYLKATCTTAGTGTSGFYKNLFDFSDGRFFGKQMTWSMEIKTSKNTKLIIGCEWGNAQDNVNTTENWQRFSKTFKVATSSNQKAWVFYSSNWNVGDIVYIRDVQLEDGSIATSPVPAIEDTESDITKLSSELTQTKDGITLLATKTELNTAKNELQSGINTATNKANSAQNKANNNAQTISTHTNQISALNTGLQAKVSQTDFNTLSGRVTTAENNITAKANELSSKITSVEGKIPTNIGTVNLIKGSGSAFVMGFGITNTTWNETKKQSILDFSVPGVRLDIQNEILPQGDKFFDFKPIKGTTYTQSIMIDTDATFNPNGQAQCTWFTSNSHNFQKAYIKKVGEYSYQVWSTYTWNLENKALRAFDWYGLHTVLGFRNSGTYLAFYKPKLTSGNLPSDWSPAPEDTTEQISSLSSELKQTKDGITLLATKTELNSAKNELQSGINTATNKANSAQSAANNNAQTINTHTTQISALNTGLQAKVSQTDFNTLSGRVTTAENNITAKANELSSKITSVEGKIPTEIGSTNLLRKTAVNTENLKLFGKADTTVSVVEKDRHQVYKLVVSGSNNAGAYFGGNNDYYNLVKDRNYTFSFWVLTNKDKNFNMHSLGHIQAVNTNSDKVGNDPAHQHTQPIYSTNVIRANTWTKVWCTFKATSNSFFRPYFWYLNAGDEIYIYDMMLNEGKVPLSYTPAPEDTISQISSLSSELKQTKDGITLLATKTELNTAKNELQSGINTATNKANSAQNKANNNAQTISTHTNQISALNTGLQAKVSQTDFNTLSGRVTTAENNITAKANELSSKITSVEGKIPTEIDTVNLVKGTGSAFVMGYGITNTTWNETKKQSILDFSVPGVRLDIQNEILPQGDKFFDFKPIKGTTYTQSIMIDTDATFNPNGQAQCTWFTNNGHNGQKAYIKKVGEYSYQVWSTYTWNLENKALRAFDWWNLHAVLDFRNSGTYLAFYKPKLTIGNLPSDWSPAPEDAINQISSLSSELKQTKDGITLLATKTELNSAKNELQSGINTATNKANAAQNTANNAQNTANSAQNKANSNAQTISTHTTQISALNTGLSAKVSQSDFNTLSGRVTTAENNITAKANELSSKITSVEGKIPTEIGSANLLRKTAVNTENLKLFGKSNSTISVVTKDGHQTYKIVVSANGSGVYFDGNSQYYNLVKDRNYTFSFWVLTNKDKSYNYNSLGHIQAVNRNGDIVGSDRVHQHTAPVYSTNTIKANTWTKVWCTFKATSNSYFTPYFWYLNSGDEIYIYDMMLNEGKIPLSYTPAPEDTISQINAVSSELKQTTDSIKASVTSLDKSTVKNSSLTINSDGIVMKAGKSTTDVANAIGSYFAVNQNAINLFSDKINVKGSMIVNGTITGDKIKASSVDVSKIVGIDANFIKSKIEYAMIDWLKGKTITAYNDNMTIDLQNGRISFKDGTNAVYRQTPDGIHTGFLHFEAGSLGGIYAAFGATSTRQGINSKSSEFAGIRCYRVSKNGDSHDAKIDKIEVIGDTIQFGHGYGSDGSIGGGFIMHAVGLENDVYSLNRIVKSIDSIWRVLYEHARNVGFNLSDRAFVKALTDEYNAWHDTHHM